VTQYQITVSNDLVHGLFKEDGAMAKLLEQVLQAEVTEALQAKPFERTEERQRYRNGFKPRTMTTRVGRLVLSVPQVRDGKFSPELFSRFQRSEQEHLKSCRDAVCLLPSQHCWGQLQPTLAGVALIGTTPVRHRLQVGNQCCEALMQRDVILVDAAIALKSTRARRILFPL
jgi:hypothetical protein